MIVFGIDPGPSPRLRQASGEAAERRADQMHRACELAGIAVVRRVSSHLRLVAGGKVVPAQRGTVDCLGVLTGGRGVAVEIKSCADRRLRLDRLPPHQRAELARWWDTGALALVLCLGPGLEAWAVPWASLEEALTLGRASLGPEELAPWACDPRRPYLERWL